MQVLEELATICPIWRPLFLALLNETPVKQLAARCLSLGAASRMSYLAFFKNALATPDAWPAAMPQQLQVLHSLFSTAQAVGELEGLQLLLAVPCNTRVSPLVQRFLQQRVVAVLNASRRDADRNGEAALLLDEVRASQYASHAPVQEVLRRLATQGSKAQTLPAQELLAYACLPPCVPGFARCPMP
jgi:hypothetical protein